MSAQTDEAAALDFLVLVEGELNQGLALFHDEAGAILRGSGVRLNPPDPAYFSLENNFFSALFLYSYIRGGIPKNRRIFYAAMNQCLRGMVTGCDNLLDDEYKVTLDTDLPSSAVKFRSVLDIMVCDRVLTALMVRGGKEGCFTLEQLMTAQNASLHALLKSGAQEASEEEGVAAALAPDRILDEIHSVKTGLLFQAPWALPEALEGSGFTSPEEVKEGLFLVGMGCQVMDDMVDLARDMAMKRHNYVLSLICHGACESEGQVLRTLLESGDTEAGDRDLLNRFPKARDLAGKKALWFLEQGCAGLFAPEHRGMIPFAVDLFTRRIGADRFFVGDR